MMIDFVKPKRKVDRVFIHCSASSNPDYGKVSIIRAWHKERGWDDIGYHYFLPFSGEIQKGRSVAKTPAAQFGHNTNTIAICLHGLRKTDFTYNQYDNLRLFCRKINDAYNGEITFHGHCEVSTKICPVFDYKEVLLLDSNGKLGPIVKSKYLDMFDVGSEVVELQKNLNVYLRPYKMQIAIDGIYGQQTAQSVIFFQKENGLTPDGIVGPLTQMKLPSYKIGVNEE